MVYRCWFASCSKFVLIYQPAFIHINTTMSSTTQQTTRNVFKTGQIKLSVYMNHGLVTVHVLEGRQLITSSTYHLDTFVMISTIPEDASLAPTRCRTAIIRNTSRPIYNQKFSFEVIDDDLKTRLLVTVWHRNNNNGLLESMGCTSFGIRHLKICGVFGWYHLLTEEFGQKKHFLVAKAECAADTVIKRSLYQIQHSISAINRDVLGHDKLEFTVHRSPYRGFGFTVEGSSPARIDCVERESLAEEAGLRPNDLVIRVNGQNVSRSTAVSVAKCIRNSANTVDLEIHRQQLQVTSPVQKKGSNCNGEDNSSNSLQDYSTVIYDDRTGLISTTLEKIKPLNFIQKLRTKTYFNRSLTRPVKV